MPIYEYYCPDNNKIYAFLSRSLARSEKIPRCPDESSYRMVKLVSNFSVTGADGKSDSEEASGGDIDDARLEAAMGELEREMAGMEKENPDPKQMGSLMRKMAEMTGEKMPPGMEEMMSRLEAGDAPEALEEEFGDLMNEDFAEGAPENASESDDKSSKKQTVSSRRLPVRDPNLYDLAEFV